MQKTTYVCDSCHKESDSMLSVSITLTETDSYRSANFHVCSEECIPTAVKMALMTAKEKGISIPQQQLKQYITTYPGQGTAVGIWPPSASGSTTPSQALGSSWWSKLMGK